MDNKQIKLNEPLLAHMTAQESQALCAELREELVQNISDTGGHLASNLGVVELTVAIHQVFDTTRDRIVFDVGHQCYTHKMITGRRDKMHTLRQFGGLAGFPKPSESIHDAFIAGHASNSVAVAEGMARARTALGEDYSVLALIGDGALTGGLAYEGLSTAGESGEQMLVILNDNGMSITRNVGGVAEHLAHQRLRPQYLEFKKNYRKIMNYTWIGRKIYRMTHGMKKVLKDSLLPSSMFESMGFTYLGPIDGHDIAGLRRTMSYAKDLQEPVLLHVRTTKGKGYFAAEKTPAKYHGVSPFNPETGTSKSGGGDNFSAVFGRTLTRIADSDTRVCAITAAMMSGTGLDGFAEAHPKRFFDVGIAEGCAVAMSAGMAKQGMIPVFPVYSTFLQRGYDMLMHDVALEGLHVVLAVDRAGLVGDDGETHHGVFDVAYLDSVPGMTVLAPANFAELEEMLHWAIEVCTGPVAVRYPRGGQGAMIENHATGAGAVLRSGTDITLTGYGTTVNDLLAVAQRLAEQGIEAEVVKLNVISPLDPQIVLTSVRKTGALLVAEDCVEAGCVGVRLSSALAQHEVRAKVVLVNEGRHFTTHGKVDLLKETIGLDVNSLYLKVMGVLNRG